MSLDPAFVPILPRTAAATPEGHLTIGGCDAVDLAREFGTPLYVFDEVELREGCREWLGEFRSRHEETTVTYAAKAYLSRALARLMAEEGLGLDVASGGELAIACAAEFPMERVYFHGNNKSAQELWEGLAAGVGHVVIDNFHEAVLLNDAAGDLKRTAAGVAAGLAQHRPSHAPVHHHRRPGQQVRHRHCHRPGRGSGAEPDGVAVAGAGRAARPHRLPDIRHGAARPDLPRRCGLRRAHGGQPRPRNSES